MAIASGSAQDDPYLRELKKLIGSGGGADGGKVYLRSERYMVSGGQKTGEGRGAPRYGKRDIWLSTAEAEQEYYNWSTKQQSDFVAQGILAGMLKFGDGPLEGASLWKKLVKEAGNYGAAGKKVSPIDLMASYVKASGGAGANAWTSAGVWQINTVTGERKYAGPGSYLGGGKAQQTDTRVDLTDPDTARSIATQLFQNLMGRDPGAGELTAFAGALRQAEEASPVVATTTTQYDMETGQALSSNTQQSGGLAADAKGLIGEQQIKKTKEYGVTQAVTTYQNAFENLIYGSPE